MKRTAVCILFVSAVARLPAQRSLPDVAQAAVSAWVAHDPQTLIGVGGSSRVTLEIPGANPSGPLAPAQAIELLRRYLRPATERAVSLGRVHEETPEIGFVELEREYVVAGTTDVRRETIYLRFQRVGPEWRLTELRATP